MQVRIYESVDTSSSHTSSWTTSVPTLRHWLLFSKKFAGAWGQMSGVTASEILQPRATQQNNTAQNYIKLIIMKGLYIEQYSILVYVVWFATIGYHVVSTLFPSTSQSNGISPIMCTCSSSRDFSCHCSFWCWISRCYKDMIT